MIKWYFNSEKKIFLCYHCCYFKDKIVSGTDITQSLLDAYKYEKSSGVQQTQTSGRKRRQTSDLDFLAFGEKTTTVST